jgi:hypothetical protein
MEQTTLIEHFNHAHVPLVLGMPTRRWINRSDIFLVEVDHHRHSTAEFIRIHCGAPDNLVLVIDADPSYQQVVLRVREPRREFIERETRADGKIKVHHRVTPVVTRHYLIGMDDGHLFIAELPHRGVINSVRDAHTLLKPIIVRERERTVTVLRQGEWFFLPLTDAETRELATLQATDIAYTNVVLTVPKPHDPHPRHPPRMLNSHVAEYGLGAFVSGKVTHHQHRTLVLDGWYRVVHNTEIMSAHRWFD